VVWGGMGWGGMVWYGMVWNGVGWGLGGDRGVLGGRVGTGTEIAPALPPAAAAVAALNAIGEPPMRRLHLRDRLREE